MRALVLSGDERPPNERIVYRVAIAKCFVGTTMKLSVPGNFIARGTGCQGHQVQAC